jgi:class 3 adenylate cyclase/tetratricopeptide (TPR) repeat protein
MKCLHCQHENAPGQKFCGECGVRIGQDLPPARFDSPQQYTPRHLAEKIYTSRSALEGERKQVTVLFADLKGSMELLADRDPEEARRILDPVLERMMEAVHHYDGTVNQVMGDGIMALFGAPLAQEDHALRACYAALRMQQAIGWYADELRRTQALDVHIRAGLNSGEVVVRSIGSDLRMDYSAIGQTTHLAARMEQLARPGTTLLTLETLRLADGYVQVRPLGPMPVKGVEQPVEVFELTGTGSARTRLQAAEVQGLTRFVGRQRELEVLDDAFVSAGKGKGRVVALVGQPGVGKSRLCHEFVHSHRTLGWLVLEASAVSYGKAKPYLPVIDLLKGYFKIGERDEARAVREKLAGKLLTLDRSLESLLPPLLSLLDQPVDDAPWQQLDPPQRRRQTLDALKRWWLREAQAQPLILLFEDLQWIDRETQEFLDGMLESVPACHLLLLLNYRPEYHHPWAGKSYFAQLRLDPLSADTAEDLLHGMLGPDPGLQPLKQLLIGRTEGNPFFLEESVRGLAESGVLGGERGNHRLLRPLENVAVPANVQAILAARIDRLAEQSKRLLQTAAVIGRDVPYAILQVIADLPEDALRQGMAQLRVAEFLYEASLFPDLEYSFKHALTHEVAYASLLRQRRHALHARIVRAIEAQYANRLDEQAERLAHHALQAQLWEVALRYLQQAARKASSRWAFREAARYLEQALEVIGRLPNRGELAEQEIDIRLELRQALMPAAQTVRIAEIIQDAVSLGEKTGDRRRLALAYAYQAYGAIELCEQPLARESALRSLALAEEIGEPMLTLSARHNLSQIYYTLADFRQAIEVARLAMETSEEIVVDALQKRTYAAVPFYLLHSRSEVGLFREAALDADTIMRRAEAAGHPFTMAVVCVGAGYMHLRRGAPARAIPLLERSFKWCQNYSIDTQIPWAAACLGLAYALAGRHESGIEYARQGVRRGEELGLTRFQPLRVTLLANAYLLAGRRESAHGAAQQALQLARRYREKGPEAWAMYLLAESEDVSRGNQAAETRSGYLSALRCSEDLGMRPVAAHCHMGLGKLYASLGDKVTAQSELQTALSMYHEMDMQHWPDQAQHALRALG